MTHYTGLINNYRSRLPIADGVEAIELGEGQTPLIKLRNIPSKLGIDAEIYVKFEGLNITGSFKDRGMTMAVTAAVADGAKAIICASTGNTSAAAAAYAARAGIKAFVLIPEGKIAMGKLAQAMIHGCEIIQIEGNFDDGMRLVKEVADHAPVTIVNSINPFRLQGQKTAAFEVVDELGDAPDYHCLPVGNAGNISGYWLGYSEYAGTTAEDSFVINHFKEMEYDRTAKGTKTPTMVGYQAAGAAPFTHGEMVDNPETVATAIRIGHPQSWDLAHAVEKESGGWFDALSDEEILAAQKLLAQSEGVFCEPASATSLAGALRDLKNGRIPQGSKIVCTLTGNGLKDPDTAMAQCADTSITTVPATLDAVKAAIVGQ
ncbi:MAG: threonine synthase [Gammaproteobacteria bacterium]|nr:threonine synthase [Gammaproteobacteria bacterium]